jgi:cation transport ATPase
VTGEILMEALTPFVAMHGEEVIAVFDVTDTIRRGSQETIESETPRCRGADVYIVSGDEQAMVNDVAARVSISPDRAFGNCSPPSKQEEIKWQALIADPPK